MKNMEQLIPIDNVLEEMKLKSALKNRVVPFIEDFTTESCYKVEYMLKKIVANDKAKGLKAQDNPITIEIKSYGGECDACYGLLSLIEELKDQGYEIICDCSAYAMSCGFLLFISGSTRKIARYGTIMCHQVSAGTYGEYQHMHEKVEHFKKAWETSKKIILKNTKITEEQLDDITVRKFDWYMDSEEALRLGCADIIK